MSTEFLKGRVAVKVGDITREQVDAVVNAANSTLLGGGGVDGAIHRAGGARILEECREIRRTQFPDGLPAGKAVITSGGKLTARFVIHTVGPVYGMNPGRDAELLADCYRNSMRLAIENNLETIAFPALSTGAFRYPRDEAARISSQAIKNFLEDNQTIKQVRLVFFSAPDAETFVKYQVFGE
ncbi:MAG TPA: O-acetyl-ADP-ribose deacetylase [Pyrinomonadaceae bacterium]|jgi:O-acetyl-ADP-ribose deacetylase (regulator of RNase III)